jgi:hypothetical protein
MEATTINFKSGYFSVTLTTEEVKKLWEDMVSAQDAILHLLDPIKEAKSWDNQYDYEGAIKFLHTLYRINWNEKLINARFANHREIKSSLESNVKL